jgi:NAD(P)-dependent dehydrogenase (short-subunit alcohol dehydrogenase family)
MKPRLEGQVAIVTGGSSGIGRETCVAVAVEGCHVVVVGRNSERVAETQALLKEATARNGTHDIGLTLDVSNESDMEKMAARTLEEFGRIDILVHAAGILRPPGAMLRTVAKMPAREFDEVIAINVRGTFLSNRAVLPAMIQQRSGNILNIASKAGRFGLAFAAPYCTSKFAVIGLSESLADEVRSYGVRVQVLLPSTFRTNVWKQSGGLHQESTMPPASRVSDTILYMLTLPMDAYVGAPFVEPLAAEVHGGRLGTGGG